MEIDLRQKEDCVLRNDYFIYLHPDSDSTSQQLREGKPYEPFETGCHKLFLRAGDTCLDVGANIGYYSFLYASRVGKVLSFEPDSDNFTLLVKGVIKNKFSNMQCFQAAVGNKTGMVYLYKNKENKGDHRTWWTQGRESASVPMVALDDFLSGVKVDFFKTDTQGCEVQVLQGARKLLTQHKNTILAVEYWPLGLCSVGSSEREFYDTIRELGFNKIYAADEVDKRLVDVSLDLPYYCREDKDWVLNLICLKG